MIRKFSSKSPLRMIMFAALYWGFIVSAIQVTMFSYAIGGGLIGTFAYALAIICIGRTMRAFEAMTHEFGHGVLPKSYQALNDLIGNVLVSIPMAITVGGMRQSHNGPHHNDLAVAKLDPDLQRYDSLDAHMLDRTNALAFAREVMVRLPTYLAGWFRALGTNIKTLCMTLAWHSAAILAFAMISGDAALALKIWVGFWLVPYVAILPVIRFIGELGEHSYFAGSDIMAVTVSNIGTVHKIFIHPLGDGYHTLHHLFSAVPGYNLAKLHAWMLENEPSYRDNLRYRLSVLEHPASAVDQRERAT